jgi:hypothetical protein
VDRQDRDQPSDVQMSVDRIADLADRHGAELSHWPRTDACAARALLAVSPEARAVLARAERLDRMLGAARTQSGTNDLRERLLAAAPAGGWRDFLISLWPFGPVWRPAAALVGLAFFGMFLGSTETAKLILPTSVNAALSEEIRVVVLSAADVLGDSNQWLE